MSTKSFTTFLILICISFSYATHWEPTDIPPPKVDNDTTNNGIDDIINGMSSFSPIFISMNTCMFVSALLGVISGPYRSVLIKALFTWYLVVMFTTNSMAGFTTNLFCFSVMFVMFLLGSCITQ